MRCHFDTNEKVDNGDKSIAIDCFNSHEPHLFDKWTENENSKTIKFLEKAIFNLKNEKIFAYDSFDQVVITCYWKH